MQYTTAGHLDLSPPQSAQTSTSLVSFGSCLLIAGIYPRTDTEHALSTPAKHQLSWLAIGINK